MKKFEVATGVVVTLMVGNIVIETAQYNQNLPQDLLQDNIILHSISGSNSGSTFGVVGFLPSTELMSTRRLNRNGNSNYVIESKRDDSYNSLS